MYIGVIKYVRTSGIDARTTLVIASISCKIYS